MKNIKSEYVCFLPQALQTKVYKAVKKALVASGLQGEELEIALQNAMNSKVYDLEDTINIERVLRSVK